MNTSDSELLTQYRFKQSEPSFRLLVERYQSMVLGTAFRRTGNLETASDVAQRVFAVLARKAGLLIGRSSIAGWLHQAALYESIRAAQSEARRSARNVPLEDDLVYTLPEPITLPTPERWSTLEQSIGSLAAPDREVLLLHYFQDQSYEEMARTLGLQEPAVRKRVSRALERLGAVLRAHGMSGNATALLLGAVAIQGTLHAPFGLTQTALAAAATGGGGSAFLTLLALLSNTTVKTVGIIAALASLPMLWWSATGSLPELAPAVVATSPSRLAPIPSNAAPAPAQPPGAQPIERSIASESPAVVSAPAASGFSNPQASRVSRPVIPATFVSPARSSRLAAAPPAIPSRPDSVERAPSSSDATPSLPDGAGTAFGEIGVFGLPPIEAAAAVENLLDQLLDLSPLDRLMLTEFLNAQFVRLSALRLAGGWPADLAQTVWDAQRESAVAEIVHGIQQRVPAAAAARGVLQAVLSVPAPVAGNVAGLAGATPAALAAPVAKAAARVPGVLPRITSKIRQGR